MSVVAELTIPSSEFALGRTLGAAPDVTVEFERVVTHGQEWVMPFLWVSEGDLDQFNDEIGRDPTVAEFTVTERFEATDLYQIRWSDDVRELINDVFDRAGVLVEATAADESWEVVVQFCEQQSLSELRSYFQDGGTAFSLDRLYTPDTPRHAALDMTPIQRETLVLAIERGYYAVPRETSLDDLAGDLGVTSTAVSQRLRRAVCALGENTFDVVGDGERDQ